jgi:hypothetical protein
MHVVGNCAICQDHMYLVEEREALSCGHTFHSMCLTAYRNAKQSRIVCPTCKCGGCGPAEGGVVDDSPDADAHRFDDPAGWALDAGGAEAHAVGDGPVEADGAPVEADGAQAAVAGGEPVEADGAQADVAGGEPVEADGVAIVADGGEPVPKRGGGKRAKSAAAGEAKAKAKAKAKASAASGGGDDGAQPAKLKGKAKAKTKSLAGGGGDGGAEDARPAAKPKGKAKAKAKSLAGGGTDGGAEDARPAAKPKGKAKAKAKSLAGGGTDGGADDGADDEADGAAPAAKSTGKPKPKAKGKAKSKPRAESTAGEEPSEQTPAASTLAVALIGEKPFEAAEGQEIQQFVQHDTGAAQLAFGTVTCNNCGQSSNFTLCRCTNKKDGLWKCSKCDVKTTQLRRAFGRWPTPEFSRLSEARPDGISCVVHCSSIVLLERISAATPCHCNEVGGGGGGHAWMQRRAFAVLL